MFKKAVLLKLLFLILSQRAEAGWMLLLEEKPNGEKFHLFQPELTLFSPLSFPVLPVFKPAPSAQWCKTCTMKLKP